MNILIIVALICIAAVSLFLKHSVKKSNDISYSLNSNFLTNAEKSFFRVLLECISDHELIFCKIRLADIVTAEKGLTKSEWQKAFNKISRKHIDFLICNSDDLSINCVIELNDKSHKRKDRIERDFFVSKCLASAGINFHQISASRNYEPNEIRAMLYPL